MVSAPAHPNQAMMSIQVLDQTAGLIRFWGFKLSGAALRLQIDRSAVRDGSLWHVL